MSLFVGNISRNVSPKELESEFSRFGACKISHRGSYAFIEYTHDSNAERDAEHAKRNLDGKNMGGLCLNIEWSKRSGKFNPSESNRPAPQKERTKDKCFNCGKIGHISRSCREEPECYECGYHGHIARECRTKTVERSRSPRDNRIMDSPQRKSPSSERSYSLERSYMCEGMLDGGMVEIKREDVQVKNEPEDREDRNIEENGKEEQKGNEGEIEIENSKFVLVDEADEPDSGLYKCVACDKTMLKSSIKRHISTKTHRENLTKA